MSKKFKIQITKADFNGIIANQEFAPLVVTNQVGDKFFVPKEDLLLVLGTGINARDTAGEEMLNEDGSNVRRQVAQHFCVVRLIDNKPVDVRELFIGQIVKIDVDRRLVFPGVLSDALQKGGDAFKTAICGSCLQIVDEKMCMDRVWDQKAMRWSREEDGSFTKAEKRVLKFEPTRLVMSAEDIEKANTMLMAYYMERYADYVTVEE